MFLIVYLVLLAIALGLTLYATKTEKGRQLWNVALSVYIKARGNLRLAHRMIRAYTYRANLGMVGAITIETIIYIFVAIVILYQLIPEIGSQNSQVQATSNISAMGKFAAGLGEWLLPLFGILALVFMLWRKKKSGV